MIFNYSTYSLNLKHRFTIARGSEEVIPIILVYFMKDGITGVGEAAPSIRYGEDFVGFDGCFQTRCFGCGQVTRGDGACARLSERRFRQRKFSWLLGMLRRFLRDGGVGGVHGSLQHLLLYYLLLAFGFAFVFGDSGRTHCWFLPQLW